MRKILLSALIVAFAGICFAQKETVHKVKPEIKNVVLYLTGVEVSHTVPLKLTQGRNLIKLDGISAQLDPKSIRVSSATDVSILAVSTNINYLTKSDEKPRIKLLKDSVNIVSVKITCFNDEIDALEAEKNMLMKNIEIGGLDNGVNILELQKGADFIYSRVFEINKRLSKLNLDKAEYTELLSNLNFELIELNAKNSYRRATIDVLVNSEKEMNSEVVVKYYIANAGWAPYYELRSEDINEPVELIYRAKVFNNTDIDWKDVSVVLSTADPSVAVTQPKLEAWKLNYYNSSSQYTYNWDSRQQTKSNEIYDFEAKQDAIPGTQVVTFAPIEVMELNIEFSIQEKYSIPSDSKPYIVDVTDYQLPATYKYLCIPKVDKDAFLLARITGWEDLNLVEGHANVYFGGSYVGNSYISTRNVNDTLDLSLGRDNKVLVTRTKLTDFSDDQLIGTKRKETQHYEIIVKNNRKAAINIEIQDQVPVSENDEIEVSVDNISNAEHNLTSGLLKWNFVLEPTSIKKLNIEYTIKYPRNKSVSTKYYKARTINCAQF